MSVKYSKSDVDGFKTFAMENGIEMEPVARSIYELQEGVVVDQVGFIQVDEHVGYSPDGLVGDEGLVEIKCHQDKKHFRIIMNGLKEVDTKYIWQCQMALYCTGRNWISLVCYNPNFKQEMIIFRIEPDPEAFKKLEIGIERGKSLIKGIENKYVRNDG